MRLRKSVEEPHPGRIAHFQPQRLIARKPMQRICEGAHIFRRHKQAFDAFTDEMPAARDISHDERAAARSSLQHCSRQSFAAPGGQDEEIGAAPYIGYGRDVAVPARTAARTPLLYHFRRNRSSVGCVGVAKQLQLQRHATGSHPIVGAHQEINALGRYQSTNKRCHRNRVVGWRQKRESFGIDPCAPQNSTAIPRIRACPPQLDQIVAVLNEEIRRSLPQE